ncbi:carboxypeptidase-like regulatory domain-containing protein [Mucilaginibacter segetis]|uniref:Carboxypeptidase-like regulatory domain-containing protein n=1 Tax=Mucilaginibacter segetis TaxID=2793071 RepID=A0A934PNM6_9SPHI|nr:carboxypeptidase-like regulatory domain-containing protein [Mucilaginibacter segetis]MBK0377884.1 carboxypeptidase-like regulatory domain-containing protein [Mucilaginibacter segetis]
MKYIIILLLMPLAGFSQLKLSGRVINTNNGKPVANASVFFNNATIGTKSGEDGTFALRNLRPGQYDLIVSVVGFEKYTQTVMINKSIVMPDIKMQPKVTMMKVVRIGNDPKRARKLRLFKEYFLGTSDFSRKCEIVNPDVIDLHFSKNENVLTGSTEDFLEIDNDALGYKLRYIVNSFVLDKTAAKVGYDGPVFFEEKDGTAEQKERWKKNRRDIYYGSVTHFLREILANRADTDYLVRNFCFKDFDKLNIDKKFTWDTLHVADYVHATDRPGVFAITNNGKLDIFYYPYRHMKFKESNLRTHQGILVATISFIDQYLYFDSNGTILNPLGVFFENGWSVTRVADLLPMDYWPQDGGEADYLGPKVDYKLQ